MNENFDNTAKNNATNSVIEKNGKRFFTHKNIFLIFLILVITFAAVLFLVVIIFFAGDKKIPSQQYQHTESSPQETQSNKEQWPILWGPPNQNCENKANVAYSFSPIAIKDIKFVMPIGELREGHIIPGDHAGIIHEDFPTSMPTKIFAPADGTIVRVERHPYVPPSGYPQNIRHYHVYIVHSCTFFTGFVHITDFTEEILVKSEELKTLHNKNLTAYESLLVNIPITAGEPIGEAWSFELLGIVTVDLTKTNKGYLNPQSYKAENWRLHAVSPFDYFEEPLRSNLHAKNPRTKEPRGSKIDFDVDGKIVGGWFEEATGGFRDESKPSKQCGNFPCPYWEGHLALVYDFIDPNQLRVSVGHNTGLATRTPYGVKGNGPDFKDIGAEDSLVKYELVALKNLNSQEGIVSETEVITENDEGTILGTMLVQLMETRRLKMEIFPGKTKEQVNTFTPNARVYER